MAMYFGWTALKQALRTSSLGFVNLLLPMGILLGLAILVLPDGVSGSFFFATRLITFVWIALLLSASDVDLASQATLRAWLVLTGSLASVIVFAAVTLIRPVAKQVALLDFETVPAEGAGLVVDPSQDLTRKARGTLEFSPFHWACAMPLTKAHKLLLDSPWLEQAILPLTFRNNSPLLNAQVSRGDAPKIHLHDGTVRWLDPESLERLLRKTSVLFYRIPVADLSLSDQIGSVNAAQFSCLSRSWYLKCVRNPVDK